MREASAPISVIIPAHNEEKFIAEAIRSVYAQTLPVSELIVIADDCTDRTAKIAHGLGSKVKMQKRRNMAAALNLGIRTSSQPWIAFLDADDLWDENKIALQWQAIESCPDAGLVACDGRALVNGEVVEAQSDLKKRWRKVSGRLSTESCRCIPKIDGEFIRNFYLQTSRVMVRRDAVMKVGLLNEAFAYWQTIEFFARVLCHYSLAYVERPLVYQRLHESNHTRNVAGYWAAFVHMTNLMLKAPEFYPPSAGAAYRETLKRDFYRIEQELARSAGVKQSPKPPKPTVSVENLAAKK